MKIAHIDCASGASGDMFLGAWLDLGVDEANWRTMLQGLKVGSHAPGSGEPGLQEPGGLQASRSEEPGYEIRRRAVFRSGIRACKVDVLVANQELHYDGTRYEHRHEHEHTGGHHHEYGSEGHHGHRHLPDIFALLEASDLPAPVREKSKLAFRALAEAEGKVHGMPPEAVHFHEVGAIDAIVDIVGAMTGWYLAGMPVCYVTPIEVGMGTVTCAHGVMPVPVPATVALLTGFPTYSSGAMGEMVTPTGAAIIRTLCQPLPQPTMTCTAFGYGAGTANRALANVLRIRIGETAAPIVSRHAPSTAQPVVGVGADVGTGVRRSDLQSGCVAGTVQASACVLEANIDDMTPELAAYAAAKLLDLGAMDTWLTPIVMKKGRPALQLHVLCDVADRPKFITAILRETSTLGVRDYRVEKTMWLRRVMTVDTIYGSVQVKVATDAAGGVMNVAPEYEDCRERAEAQHVPLKEVYRAALAAVGGGADEVARK